MQSEEEGQSDGKEYERADVLFYRASGYTHRGETVYRKTVRAHTPELDWRGGGNYIEKSYPTIISLWVGENRRYGSPIYGGI